MMPVKKKQKEDVITENVKSSGCETLVSRNEILKLMEKKKIFLSGISVAQYQSSLPSLRTVSKPQGFGFYGRQ